MPTVLQLRRLDNINVIANTGSLGELLVDMDGNAGRGKLTLHDGSTVGGIPVSAFETDLANTYTYITNIVQTLSIGQITANTDFKLDINGAIEFDKSINNKDSDGFILGTGAINFGSVGSSSNGNYSVIGGGANNHATGNYISIPGGHKNSASTNYAFIGTGANNNVEGEYSSIVNGSDNIANGDYSFIGTGKTCKATGDYSLAVGNKAESLHDGAMVFGDSTVTLIQSDAANQVKFQAPGGFYIGGSANTQHVLPQANVTYDIGSADYMYRKLYVENIYSPTTPTTPYNAFPFRGSINTTERDTLSPAAIQPEIIYNTTVSKWQYYNGSEWATLLEGFGL